MSVNCTYQTGQALLADGVDRPRRGGAAPVHPSRAFALGELAIHYEERRVTVAGRRWS